VIEGSAPRPRIATARLALVADDAALGAAVADFYRRNRRHLAPWDPPTPAHFFTEAVQAVRVAKATENFRLGSALRWWLVHEGQVVGSAHVSAIERGPFCSAHLGYALDAALQGQGLMHEALSAVVDEVFSPRVNLHRLQAAWRPENQRSGAVLQRLGFADIGLAPHYLYIDGAWRDHRLAQRLNPAFTPPADWATPPAPGS